MFIKRSTAGYFIEEDHIPLARFNDFTTAALVCRFLKGAQLQRIDYNTAVQAMHESDTELLINPQTAVKSGNNQ